MKKCVILNDTTFDYHHGCEIVINNIIQLLDKINIETICTNPVGVCWKKNKKFLEKMALVDIVIVNGEGSIHHGNSRARDLLSIGKYVKEKFNIPIVLMNTTYQDNGKLNAKYLHYFDLIFVRESMSQKDIQNFGIKSEVVPDMTFYSEFNIMKQRTKRIGVTDSVSNKTSKFLYQLATENDFLYLPALTNPKVNWSSFYSIYKAFKFYIYKYLKLIRWKLSQNLDVYVAGTLFYIDDYEKYINKISKLQYIIIGRYHSLCFALKTNTPFLALKSNTFKIESMLNDVGIREGRMCDSNNYKEEMLSSFTNEEQQKINDYIKNARFKIDSMFNKIQQLLN